MGDFHAMQRDVYVEGRHRDYDRLVDSPSLYPPEVTTVANLLGDSFDVEAPPRHLKTPGVDVP
jgi:hypothetical protein